MTKWRSELVLLSNLTTPGDGQGQTSNGKDKQADRRTVPKPEITRVQSGLVDFVILIVGLEEDCLLRPDQRPGGLEIEIRFRPDLLKILGCPDGSVDELLDRVGTVGYFSNIGVEWQY